jgi:hypothetical protein
MLLRYETEGRRYQPDVVVLAFAGFHMGRNTSGFTFFAKPHFELAADGSLTPAGVPVPSPAEMLAADGEDSPRLADSSVLLRWAWQRVRNANERRLYRAEGPGWLLTRALIARFAADAHAAGSSMVLLNVDENFPQLEGPLTQLAADLSIEFADAAPPLSTLKASGVEYRLHNDNHWNATGHRAVAALLQRRLCESVLRGHCSSPTDSATVEPGQVGA